MGPQEGLAEGAEEAAGAAGTYGSTIGLVFAIAAW